MQFVNITLEDVNDNRPIFSEKEYTVSFPENTSVNTVIATVKATDKDAGSNGIIHYQKLNMLEFRIDTTTGEIRLNEVLDYDRFQRNFDIPVNVFDRGSPPKFANTVVKVGKQEYIPSLKCI